MNQHIFDLEISRRTGEALAKIAPLGFIPLTSRPAERRPLTVDWDEREAERYVALSPRRTRTPLIV